jgi:hypothetical protein
MTARRAFVKPLRKLPISQPQSREPACAVSLPALSRKNVYDARDDFGNRNGKPPIGIYRSGKPLQWNPRSIGKMSRELHA